MMNLVLFLLICFGLFKFAIDMGLQLKRIEDKIDAIRMAMDR